MQTTSDNFAYDLLLSLDRGQNILQALEKCISTAIGHHCYFSNTRECPCLCLVVSVGVIALSLCTFEELRQNNIQNVKNT